MLPWKKHKTRCRDMREVNGSRLVLRRPVTRKQPRNGDIGWCERVSLGTWNTRTAKQHTWKSAEAVKRRSVKVNRSVYQCIFLALFIIARGLSQDFTLFTGLMYNYAREKLIQSWHLIHSVSVMAVLATLRSKGFFLFQTGLFIKLVTF